MAKIPIVAFIFFGLVLTIASKYLQDGKDPFFQSFFYVGLLFIVWVVIRIIIKILIRFSFGLIERIRVNLL